MDKRKKTEEDERAAYEQRISGLVEAISRTHLSSMTLGEALDVLHSLLANTLLKINNVDNACDPVLGLLEGTTRMYVAMRTARRRQLEEEERRLALSQPGSNDNARSPGGLLLPN